MKTQYLEDVYLPIPIHLDDVKRLVDKAEITGTSCKAQIEMDGGMGWTIIVVGPVEANVKLAVERMRKVVEEIIEAWRMYQIGRRVEESIILRDEESIILRDEEEAAEADKFQ